MLQLLFEHYQQFHLLEHQHNYQQSCNPSLLVKVAATYSALNGTINAPVSDTRWATVHAFGVALGLKPTFMDGKMWLSVLARYGMNEEVG